MFEIEDLPQMRSFSPPPVPPIEYPPANIQRRISQVRRKLQRIPPSLARISGLAKYSTSNLQVAIRIGFIMITGRGA